MTTTFNRYIALAVSISLLCSWATETFAVVPEAYHSYVRGLLAQRAGDASAALEEFENVVALDKDATLVYRDLAFLYLQAGKPADALAAIRTLSEKAPASVETQLFLGNFYLMSGEPDKARDAWDKALTLDKTNETATLYLAAYYSARDPEKALTYWRNYLIQEPGSSEGYYQLGITQEKLGRNGEAVDSLQQSIAIDPANKDAHLSLAQVYEKDEKLGAAVQEYEKYLHLSPDNAPLLMYLGGLYYRMKNYSAAEDIFTRALKLTPNDRSIFFWLGILAEERKDWPTAIRYFEAIRKQEETPVVLTRLSYYYSVTKNYPAAIKALKRAGELEPDNARINYLLGLTYADMKRFRIAEESYNRALSKQPDFQEAYFHRGVLYEQWGKFDKAVADFNKLLTINPENASALNYLGYSYADRGIKLDEAEQLISRALEIEPKNGAFLDSRGWIFYKKGAYASAEEFLAKAAATVSDAIVFEHLGDVKLKLNKIVEARAAYTRALQLEPGNRELEHKLVKVKDYVLPDTEQRKVLKRVEGSLLQVSTLRFRFSVAGQSPEYNYRSYGTFQYRRPRQWRADILGSFLSPQIIAIRSELQLTVYPQQIGQGLRSEDRDLIVDLGDFFSAGLLSQFDNETVRVCRRRGNFFYSSDKATLLIDRKHGYIKEYTQGKRVVLRFKKYRDVEGIPLPGVIEIFLPAEKVQLEIKTSDYSLNKPIDDSLFLYKGEAIAR